MVSENNETMKEMMEQYEFKKIHTGDIIKGKVIKINDEEVFVNINHFSDGIIPKNEITKNENEELQSLVSLDDEIYVMITKTDDGEGNVLLSKLKADSIKGMEDLEEAYNNKTAVEKESLYLPLSFPLNMLKT